MMPVWVAPALFAGSLPEHVVGELGLFLPGPPYLETFGMTLKQQFRKYHRGNLGSLCS